MASDTERWWEIQREILSQAVCEPEVTHLRLACERIAKLEQEVLKARVAALNADRSSELAENAKRIAALEAALSRALHELEQHDLPPPESEWYLIGGRPRDYKEANDGD